MERYAKEILTERHTSRTVQAINRETEIHSVIKTKKYISTVWLTELVLDLLTGEAAFIEAS